MSDVPIPEGIVEDPTDVKILTPKKCKGCGVYFQSEYMDKPGYVEKRHLDEYASGKFTFPPKMKGQAVEFAPQGARLYEAEVVDIYTDE